MKKVKEKRNAISPKNESGFALFYTILIIGVVLIATSIFLETALEELYLTSDRYESSVADYMSESGISCLNNLQTQHDLFLGLSDEDSYSCGDNLVEVEGGWKDEFVDPDDDHHCHWDNDKTVIVGFGLDEGEYDSEDYDIVANDDPFFLELDAYDEACARLEVEARSLSDGGCRVLMRSVGISRCDDDGEPKDGAVERTRREVKYKTP